jgi:hypothetical protein
MKLESYLTFISKLSDISLGLFFDIELNYR